MGPFLVFLFVVGKDYFGRMKPKITLLIALTAIVSLPRVDAQILFEETFSNGFWGDNG